MKVLNLNFRLWVTLISVMTFAIMFSSCEKSEELVNPKEDVVSNITSDHSRKASRSIIRHLLVGKEGDKIDYNCSGNGQYIANSNAYALNTRAGVSSLFFIKNTGKSKLVVRKVVEHKYYYEELYRYVLYPKRMCILQFKPSDFTEGDKLVQYDIQNISGSASSFDWKFVYNHNLN